METYITQMVRRLDVFMLSHFKKSLQKCVRLLPILNKPFIRILLLTIVATILLALTLSYKDTYKQAFKIDGFSDVESVNAHSSNLEQSQQTSTTQKAQPRQAIVVVDPGHGGDEWGTFRDNVYEKATNLDISLKLGKMLDENGIKVIYTRTTDKYMDLKGRAQIANDINADLFVSIHNNYMPGRPDYKGTETLYCPPNNHNDSTFDGEKFAEIVQRQLVSALKTHDNGIIYRPNLAVLRRTEMPAVIAEIAYISNSNDRNKLTQTSFKTKAAQALSKAVLESLGIIGAQISNDGKWMFN